MALKWEALANATKGPNWWKRLGSPHTSTMELGWWCESCVCKRERVCVLQQCVDWPSLALSTNSDFSLCLLVYETWQCVCFGGLYFFCMWWIYFMRLNCCPCVCVCVPKYDHMWSVQKRKDLSQQYLVLFTCHLLYFMAQKSLYIFSMKIWRCTIYKMIYDHDLCHIFLRT
jgi:hypothetical protein